MILDGISVDKIEIILKLVESCERARYSNSSDYEMTNDLNTARKIFDEILKITNGVKYNLHIILFFCFFQSNGQIFESANNYYSNGDYNGAINLYLQILDSGYESHSLYFNLGNSYYKLNNIAESNYYFEMAKVISK